MAQFELESLHSAPVVRLSVKRAAALRKPRHQVVKDTSPDRPVMYVRKSSPNDTEQFASYERQERDLDQILRRDGYEPEKVFRFEESQTAMIPGRPLFNEMLDRIEAGEFNVLYTHEVSRLARNMLEHGRFIHLVQTGIIRRVVTPGKTYLPEDNTLLLAIEAGVATEDSRALSRRVESSLRNKHAKGQYPGKAPLGYLNDLYGIKGDRKILKDPERFDLVRRLWELMATGSYSVRDILRIAQREYALTTPRYGKIGGGPVSYPALYAMFGNPFYCGLYQWGGRLIQGSHPPMVSESEFERVQTLIHRRHVHRPHQRRKDGRPLAASTDVPYLGGFIRCGGCGGVITAEAHTKTLRRTGTVVRYLHLRCSKRLHPTCPEKYLSLAAFEEQAEAWLERLTLPEAVAYWALETLRSENAAVMAHQEVQISSITEQLARNQQARKRLTDLLLEGRIEEAEFDERREQIAEEYRRLSEELTAWQSGSNQWLEDVESAFSFCTTLKARFTSGSAAERRRLLEIVSSNRIIRGQKLLLEPIDLLQKVADCKESNDWSALQEYVRTKVGAMRSLAVRLEYIQAP